MGVEVVGVSGDTVEGQKLFKQVNELPFTLLADEEGNVAKALGVPLKAGGVVKKTIDGKNYELKRAVTTARWTFVIGRDGTIIHKDTAVKAGADVRNVLEALKKAKGT